MRGAAARRGIVRHGFRLRIDKHATLVDANFL
jgi:hypothetical protein